MKKILFSLFFIALFMFPTLADFTLDSVGVTAEVSASGRTEVTGSYQLTFTLPQDEVTIPLPEGDVSGISVSNYRFSTQETEQGVNLVVRNSKGFSGTQLFVVSYTVSPFQADGSEEDVYTLPLLSSRWAKAIGSFSVQLTLPGSTVELPEDYTMEPQLLSGYYGDLDPVEAPMTVTGTTVSGSVTDLMAYDTMTVQISLPDGYFRVRSNTIPMISVTWWFLGMAMVLIVCGLYWRLKLRSKKNVVSARLLLPEGVLAYQLPGVLDGKTVDFAALILEWANLGYLRLGYDKRHRLILTKILPMGSERTAAEQWLFSKMFNRRTRAVMLPGRYAAYGEKFRSAAMKPVNRLALDKKSGNVALIRLPCQLMTAVGIGYLGYTALPEGAGYLVLAVMLGVLGLGYSVMLHRVLIGLRQQKAVTLKTLILLGLGVMIWVWGLMYGAFLEVTVGLVACLFSACSTAAGPRRSLRGQELVAQAKGCRRFYKQVSPKRLEVYNAGNPRFFQSELPKALALNCHKTFAGSFEKLAVPYPEWLPSKQSRSRTPEQLMRLLKPVIQTIRQAFSQ